MIRINGELKSSAQHTIQPLVTFALLSYNQENYIREAIEGALSQSYQPLEIIISDDFSTDKTFQIINELASQYSGPHSLVTRQNKCNLGLIKHVNFMMENASADIVVLAAGDDISENVRVEVIAKTFASDPEIMLVHSNATLIDSRGYIIGSKEPPVKNSNANPLFLAGARGIYIGATGAIRRDVFDKFGPIHETKTYEDLTFGFRASLIGKLAHLSYPLVKYRANVGISSANKFTLMPYKEARLAAILQEISIVDQHLIDNFCVHHKKKLAIQKKLFSRKAQYDAQILLYIGKFDYFQACITSSAHIYLLAALAELKAILWFFILIFKNRISHLFFL